MLAELATEGWVPYGVGDSAQPVDPGPRCRFLRRHCWGSTSLHDDIEPVRGSAERVALGMGPHLDRHDGEHQRLAAAISPTERAVVTGVDIGISSPCGGQRSQVRPVDTAELIAPDDALRQSGLPGGRSRRARDAPGIREAWPLPVTADGRCARSAR